MEQMLQNHIDRGVLVLFEHHFEFYQELFIEDTVEYLLNRYDSIIMTHSLSILFDGQPRILEHLLNEFVLKKTRE
jgi:hypothetical protein